MMTLRQFAEPSQVVPAPTSWYLADLTQALGNPDGRRQVRFRTVRAGHTSAYMAELVQRWHEVLKHRTIHPLIALGAFNLDFLCIHPFRDGNGRVSRLLLLLLCYHQGLEVGRYVSLERLIEQNKERYYETLKLSSDGWHKGKHDPWYYINFLLYTLLDAYKEFERRVGDTASPRGEKRALVERSAASSVAERLCGKRLEAKLAN